MKAKDSIKLWFKTLEDMGESSKICILTEHENEGVKEYVFDHGEFDAISGFIQNIGKVDDLKTNLKKRDKNVSGWKYLIGFLRYIIRIPFFSSDWNKYNRSWREKVNKIYPRGFYYCDEAETKLIRANAQKRNITLNSFLLFNLDYSLSDKFNKMDKRVWLIPVNMRQDFNHSAQGNEVGFIDAVITKKLNMNQLHTQIKRRIYNYEHLGGVLGVSLGVFIGAYLLKKLVRINKYLQVRTGVFTNLGEWSSKGREDEKIIGFPPVIETQPIGASALTWNGRLALGIHAHPCLEFSQDEINNILKKWINFIKEQ